MLKAPGVASVGLTALLVSAPHVIEAAAITLTARSKTVNVGDTFDIPISVANTTGLTSFQFDVGWTVCVVC